MHIGPLREPCTSDTHHLVGPVAVATLHPLSALSLQQFPFFSFVVIAIVKGQSSGVWLSPSLPGYTQKFNPWSCAAVGRVCFVGASHTPWRTFKTRYGLTARHCHVVSSRIVAPGANRCWSPLCQATLIRSRLCRATLISPFGSGRRWGVMTGPSLWSRMGSYRESKLWHIHFRGLSRLPTAPTSMTTQPWSYQNLHSCLINLGIFTTQPCLFDSISGEVLFFTLLCLSD